MQFPLSSSFYECNAGTIAFHRPPAACTKTVNTIPSRGSTGTTRYPDFSFDNCTKSSATNGRISTKLATLSALARSNEVHRVNYGGLRLVWISYLRLDLNADTAFLRRTQFGH